MVQWREDKLTVLTGRGIVSIHRLDGQYSLLVVTLFCDVPTKEAGEVWYKEANLS